MVLDMAGFTPLRVPAWVNVPAGALNHTAVMRDRSALLLRSCSTTPLAEQLSALQSKMPACQAATYSLTQRPPQRPVGCDLLTYPLCELPQ